MSQKAATELAQYLEELAEKLESHNNGAKFSDHWSWQASTLTTSDLSYVARKIAERIEAIEWSESDTDTTSVLEDLGPKVKVAVANNAQNAFAGYQAAEAIQTLLSSIDIQIDSIVTPAQLRRSSIIPAAFRRSVTNAVERLDAAASSIDGIAEKVTSINSAYEASKRLPTTLEDLETTVSDIEKLKVAAARHELAAQQHQEAAKASVAALAKAHNDAESTLAKVRSAYRAATSEGLAHAFETKSNALQRSVHIWLVVLFAALLVAGLLAFYRLPEVLKTLSDTQSIGALLLRFALGVGVVAPPIWLAWVATKQIGQRFRLAEDYAYKAALSAAYEGYKAEAERLDPLLEAELFATALGRFDEIPLRLVEGQVHGSPLHELLKTDEFKLAINNSPDLKKRVIKILKPDPRRQEEHHEDA